jgi:hypothetical protein
VTTLAPPVADAVGAVRAHFADSSVEVTPDGAGGAFVVITSVDVGPRYAPSTTWLGFHISAAYPDADTYPHYVSGDLGRADGQAHGPGIQQVTWQGRPALQISRRSNHRDAAVDSAALKAERIRRWFADQ